MHALKKKKLYLFTKIESWIKVQCLAQAICELDINNLNRNRNIINNLSSKGKFDVRFVLKTSLVYQKYNIKRTVQWLMRKMQTYLYIHPLTYVHAITSF